MDNHLPPFPTPGFPFTSAVIDAAAATPSGMLLSAGLRPTISPQNSHLPICDPLGFSSTPQSYFLTTHHEAFQFPTSYSFNQATCQSSASSFLSYGFRPTPGGVGNETTNSLISKDEGRRVMDAWTTKVARSKRRLARQRSLSLNRGSSLSVFGCTEDSKVLTNNFSSSDVQINNNNNNRSRNLFTFSTPDKKILRMLLRKELKNSDVGSLGRIVLPKREAEENLPSLSDKEGIQVVIRDVNSHRKWTMKYKYWANNRSRMYVLENTGDFVRQNGLVIGDLMTLYEDECKNLYVSIKNGENHSSMEENEGNRHEQSATAYTNMDVKDEEEASLALLIEELKHKAEDELESSPCNNLIVSGTNSDPCNNSFERGCYISRRPTLTMAAAAGGGGGHERPSSSSSSYMRGKEKEEEDFQTMSGFEDCFGGLDTLPEVSGFKSSLFDYLSNDRTYRRKIDGRSSKQHAAEEKVDFFNSLAMELAQLL